MSLTVGKIYKASSKYKIRFLAGEDGLGNNVKWVHMIETVEGAGFLHGQELIVTAGILEGDEDKLLTFIKTLIEKEACALIINTGMFINTIPGSVIAYCNENNFPLFTIPWEIPLVDVTKDYCQRIINDEVREDSIITIFKNLIFQIGNADEQLRQMERFGYMSSSHAQCLCIGLDMTKDTNAFVTASERISNIVRRLAADERGQFLTFEYHERRIVVLVDYTAEEIESYVNRLTKKLSAENLLKHSFIGIGENSKGLESQVENFKRAYCACDIAIKKGENILKYKDIGLYKLFASITDNEKLTEYYKDTLGKLIEYDRESGTEIYRFIKTYIACNGHQGKVSEEFFVHRNTVNNYIKKAEEIMDIDLSSWEGKAKLFVAYELEKFL